MGYVTRAAFRSHRRTARRVRNARRNGQFVITGGMIVWCIIIVVVLVALVSMI
jgi:hypothetical protein